MYNPDATLDPHMQGSDPHMEGSGPSKPHGFEEPCRAVNGAFGKGASGVNGCTMDVPIPVPWMVWNMFKQPPFALRHGLEHALRHAKLPAPSKSRNVASR